MGRGHGSSRGGGGASGFRGDRTMSGYSAGLAKAVTAREDEIRGSANERVSIFDEQGNEVYRNDNGSRNHVEYNAGWAKDNIMTHSHPRNSSLSADDVVEGAIRWNMKETRAVAPNYTFTMKRPAKGWRVNDMDSFKKARSLYAKITKRVTNEMLAYTKGYKGNFSTAAKRAELIGEHRINKEFAKAMGYEYTAVRTK